MSETTRPNIVRAAIMLAMAAALAIAVSATAGADQALAKGKWYGTNGSYYSKHVAPKDTVTSKYVTVRGKLHKMKHGRYAFSDKIYRSTLSGKKHRYKLTKKTKFYVSETVDGDRWRVSKKKFLKLFKANRGVPTRYRDGFVDEHLVDIYVKVYKGKALSVDFFYHFGC